MLEVSDPVPSISDRFGHHFSEGVGFKILWSSDFLSFRTGHTMPIDYTVFFQESFFGCSHHLYMGQLVVLGTLAVADLCCSVVSKPTVRYDSVFSSSYFSFPHSFAVVNTFIGRDDYIMV